MEQETRKFLQAEETAEKLVETLKQIHNEATSYQTATRELDDVRKRLLSLIESTEKVVNGSHEIVKILKEIGGPEILSRLTEVENKSKEDFAKQSKVLNNIKVLIILTFTSSAVAIITGIITLLR
ncbi:hypothetical protein COS91_01875 [Candidatus Desantisbacteria bacterium CG07_land_8_20_14_0_80_39_15]|uniref:Uncharacterized protein n=2 Tax=unclassified Candidatus Desantisiibacteriota TaxID=3106372 RepID=A0A2H9PBM9_9BACT|nr:MAG: hypothetical protein COS91_01875 [Candidatus Desantisbacteria bacterium CG07_land_8_20_14_0_80_39_15]PIZ15222.1 MAG: hypothetical protein COY51_05890 [Candidatus Desantisbacteria bacterium CG_4_10_14_0_8_um_filter_39_17]